MAKIICRNLSELKWELTASHNNSDYHAIFDMNTLGTNESAKKIVTAAPKAFEDAINYCKISITDIFIDVKITIIYCEPFSVVLSRKPVVINLQNDDIKSINDDFINVSNVDDDIKSLNDDVIKPNDINNNDIIKPVEKSIIDVIKPNNDVIKISADDVVKSMYDYGIDQHNIIKPVEKSTIDVFKPLKDDESYPYKKLELLEFDSKSFWTSLHKYCNNFRLDWNSFINAEPYNGFKLWVLGLNVNTRDILFQEYYARVYQKSLYIPQTTIAQSYATKGLYGKGCWTTSGFKLGKCPSGNILGVVEGGVLVANLCTPLTKEEIASLQL